MSCRKKPLKTGSIVTALVLVSALVCACGGSDEGSAPPSRFEGALEIDFPFDPGDSFFFRLPTPAFNEFSGIALEDGTLWVTFPTTGVGQAKFLTAPRPRFSENTGKILAYRFIATDYLFGNPDKSIFFNRSDVTVEYTFEVLNERDAAPVAGFVFTGLVEPTDFTFRPSSSPFRLFRFNNYIPQPIPEPRYNYNQAARPSDIAGIWGQSLMLSLNGQLASGPIAVKVGGAPEFGRIPATALSVETTTVCNLTGSVVPRPSGKNVFNVTLSAGGNDCVIAGQSYTGVAVPYLDKTNMPRLQIMTLNEGKNSYASLSLQR